MPDGFDQGGKEIKPNRVSFSKIGDYVIGYFSGSKKVNTANGEATLYELKGVMGEYHNAETTSDANGNKVIKVDEQATPVEAGEYYTVFGGKQSVDDGFRKAKLGQRVGIKFKEAIASKKAGNSAFKVMSFKVWEEFDPEYNGQSPEDIV